MLPFDSDLEENSVWHELAASSEVIASCPCKVEPASSVRAVDSRGWQGLGVLWTQIYLNDLNCHISPFNFFFLFIDLKGREWRRREEGEGEGEREREREINLFFHLFIYSLVNSCMCPDWGLNLQPCCIGIILNQLSYLARAVTCLSSPNSKVSTFSLASF